MEDHFAVGYHDSMATPDHTQVFLDALTRISEAMDENISRSEAIQRRAAELRKEIEEGRSVAEAVTAEERPRVVELLTANMTILETSGAEFRAVKARALRADGLTIEAIAGLFGVTRQRISALLKQKAATASE